MHRWWEGEALEVEAPPAERGVAGGARGGGAARSRAREPHGGYPDVPVTPEEDEAWLVTRARDGRRPARGEIEAVMLAGDPEFEAERARLRGPVGAREADEIAGVGVDRLAAIIVTERRGRLNALVPRSHPGSTGRSDGGGA